MHRRQPRAECQSIDLNSTDGYERVDTNIKGVRATAKRFETGRDVLRSPDLQCGSFETERLGRCLNLAQLQQGEVIAHIGYDRQPAETGDNLAQKLESLAYSIGVLAR